MVITLGIGPRTYGLKVRISGYERTLNAPKYRTRFFLRDGQLLDEPLSTD